MATQQTTQETIIEHIRRDHRKTDREILELELRLHKHGDEELGPVFAPMKKELLGHMAAEEEHLYPLLEKGEARHLIADARKEHAAIRKQLEELAAGGKMERTEWSRRLQLLKQEIEHHVTEEEGQVLAAARRVFDDRQLRELGARFERAETASG
ncbi:MAG: hemerythrin domain-containing protein [Methanospirillum sp.]